MNSLGGYFGMELRKGNEYHKNAIRLNTARNALELILKNRKLKKVYIPYYTCDVILEPLHKLNLEYEFYSINKNFEPVFNYDAIKANEGFLYTNYFGLKDTFIASLTGIYKNLIIDNYMNNIESLLQIHRYLDCLTWFEVNLIIVKNTLALHIINNHPSVTT